MGGACSAYGGEERGIHRVCWRNLWERDHLEDPAVNRRIILRWMDLREVEFGGMDWIELA